MKVGIGRGLWTEIDIDLNMVNKADVFATRTDKNWEICHDASICMSDGSSLEMEVRIVKLKKTQSNVGRKLGKPVTRHSLRRSLIVLKEELMCCIASPEPTP